MKALLAMIGLAACGGAHHDPTPPAPAGPDAAPALVFDDAAARELADGLLEVLGAMAGMVDVRVPACATQPDPCDGAADCACQADCPSLASDFAAIFDAAAPLFELAARVQADDEAARRAVTAMKVHTEAAAVREERISEGLRACRDSPEVIEVIERMPTL